MIANWVKTEPGERGIEHVSREQRATGCSRTKRHRPGPLFAGIAILVGMCVASAAFGRQNSSSESTQAEQQLALVNALRAAQDVDVGTFYMHKGDYGAAISRFEEAVRLDPRNPKARLLLAESYAKQGDWTNAIKTYKAYLREFPNARDEKKVRKKIEDLSRKED
jgi:cytochrome c-type biogenesis protein CcmH/NrfG